MFPSEAVQNTYLFRAIVVVLNDRRFIGTYPTYFVVHVVHFTIGILFTFWWLLPLFFVVYWMNPLWYLFPFITVWDYIILVERYAQWRTNIVMSGMQKVLINVMLSEAGYSSTVVRAKLPLFGLVHSRRRKVLAFIFNTPLAIPKLIYTCFISILLVVLNIWNPITRAIVAVYTAPSVAFFASESYLRGMRKFPYYQSKYFFADHRCSFYNLGYSIAIPRQFPLASFIFGYIEIFEVALLAIDMEQLRENHQPRFSIHSETDLKPLEYQYGKNYRDFYSKSKSQ